MTTIEQIKDELCKKDDPQSKCLLLAIEGLARRGNWRYFVRYICGCCLDYFSTMNSTPHNQHGRRSRETDPEFFAKEPVVYRGLNDIEDALDRGDLNYVNNWLKEQYQKTHNHE